MAIQIRSIGANRDVVSVSLSASVSESPAKLSVTTLGESVRKSNISNVGGISFAGQLLSYSVRKQQGKILTTHEYIDNSVRLDQSCIVLFRRGLGGKPIVVTKRVTVPSVSVGYSRGQVTFRFGSKNLNIAVQRYAGYSSSGLGQEDWSSNPCDSSNVTYQASQALSIIGAPGNSSMRCSYEGTFRSVLSSIYSDIGVGYWWNWTNSKIEMIKDTSIKFNVPKEGCGILSLDYGETREGVSSQSSWVFSRWPSLEIQEAGATITDNSYFTVSPTKHPNFPTDSQILEKVCPPLSTYRALLNNDFRKLGYSIVSEIYFSVSTIDSRWRQYLAKTFGFDLKNTNFQDALYKYLNIQGSGRFYLAYPLNNNPSSEEYTSELYYEYDGSYSFDGSGGDEFRFRKIQTSFNPEPSQRGKNPFASTFEDQNNIVRKGLWRGVSEYVAGDVDAEDFALSVEDCIKTVPHDVICQILDQRSLPSQGSVVPVRSVNSGSARGGYSLREDIEKNGKVIIFVKSPRYSIGVNSISSLNNQNDIADTYDYKDPNAIIDEPPPPDKPGITDPCGDIVPNLTNSSLNLTFNNGVENGRELSPGLAHARGNSYAITCNGRSIQVTMPSLSSYRVVRSTVAEYSQANIAGNAQAINSWSQSGGTSSTYGLSHGVSVTDVTPNGNEPFSSFDVPSAIGGAGQKWLSTLSAECDGFFLPIVPGLESLSASLDSRGLRVSYSYKEIPIRPKTFRLINSSKRNNTSSTFS